MSSVWNEEYRPEELDDIVGQDDLVIELQELITHGVFQHYIFYSEQAGCGKTSTALACAAQMGWPIHIFNASSKETRGIEFVEKELIPLTTIGREEQIILLDEADQLTPAAQSALKGVIENASGYFILTCNDLGKVSDYLQSRCQVRIFAPITSEDIDCRIRELCQYQAGVNYDASASRKIAKFHYGDLRNAISAYQTYITLAKTDKDPLAGHKFLLKMEDEHIDYGAFLRICINDQDLSAGLKIIRDAGVGHPPSTEQLKSFILGTHQYAIYKEGISAAEKLRVVEAGIVSLRDLKNGIDGRVVMINYIRLLIKGGKR